MGYFVLCRAHTAAFGTKEAAGVTMAMLIDNNNSIANGTLRDKHRLVQVHIGTGLGLYALFALFLTTALVQHKFAMTASLVAWTAMGILLGLLLSL